MIPRYTSQPASLFPLTALLKCFATSCLSYEDISLSAHTHTHCQTFFVKLSKSACCPCIMSTVKKKKMHAALALWVGEPQCVMGQATRTFILLHRFMLCAPDSPNDCCSLAVRAYWHHFWILLTLIFLKEIFSELWHRQKLEEPETFACDPPIFLVALQKLLVGYERWAPFLNESVLLLWLRLCR